jgi:photosystem II stability/assembly factor-like uncharacterized protein
MTTRAIRELLAVRRSLGILAALALAALMATGAAAEEEQAFPSRLATETLLLDVARAGGRLVAVGEWGHVVLSDDSGETWRQAESVPTRVTLTDVTFVDPRHGWTVGHDQVVLHTRDGGEHWERQFAAPEEESPLLGVWFENTRHGIAVGAFASLLETADGGQTWKRRRISDDPDEDYHLNAIFGGPGGSIFVPAEFGSIFRSTDAGASWERIHPPYEGSFWGGLFLDDGAVLVFGMRGHVFRSDDRGETWQAVASNTDQSLQNAEQLADGAVAVVGLGGVVLTSRDGGRSFSAAVQPDRRGIASVAEGPDGTLLLFGERGVKAPSAGIRRLLK